MVFRALLSTLSTSRTVTVRGRQSDGVLWTRMKSEAYSLYERPPLSEFRSPTSSDNLRTAMTSFSSVKSIGKVEKHSFYRTLTVLRATRALQSGQLWAIRPARSDWFCPGRVHEIPRKGKDFRPDFRAPSTDSPDHAGCPYPQYLPKLPVRQSATSSARK
jgi:hypothetical protein